MSAAKSTKTFLRDLLGFLQCCRSLSNYIDVQHTLFSFGKRLVERYQHGRHIKTHTLPQTCAEAIKESREDANISTIGAQTEREIPISYQNHTSSQKQHASQNHSPLKEVSADSWEENLWTVPIRYDGARSVCYIQCRPTLYLSHSVRQNKTQRLSLVLLQWPDVMSPVSESSKVAGKKNKTNWQTLVHL